MNINNTINTIKNILGRSRTWDAFTHHHNWMPSNPDRSVMRQPEILFRQSNYIRRLDRQG